MADNEKHLFIDTNVWLSLFHFSKNDLKNFSNLRNFIGKDVILYLTEQVHDEIKRNRENKIKDALESFKNFDLKFPNIVKGYNEYEKLKIQLDRLKECHKKFLVKLDQEILEEKTPTDKIIREFFENVPVIARTDDVVKKAKLRYSIGNPPGKDNKYGDAINWELLLKHVPVNKDLYLISEDKDYVSVLDNNVIMPFLQKEWNEKKNAKVFFFRNLSDFFGKYYKVLQTESEKNDLINGLSISNSFAMTHSLIDSLRKYSDFTEQQKNLLFQIANENTQVKWILTDEVISEFYRALLPKTSGKDTNDIKVIREILEL